MAVPSRGETEGLAEALGRLLVLIEDVATIESGPHIEAKQAYVVVRHSKFVSKKARKKAGMVTDTADNGVSSEPSGKIAGEAIPVHTEEAVFDSETDSGSSSDNTSEDPQHPLEQSFQPSKYGPDAEKTRWLKVEPVHPENNRYAKPSEPIKRPGWRNNGPHQYTDRSRPFHPFDKGTQRNERLFPPADGLPPPRYRNFNARDMPKPDFVRNDERQKQFDPLKRLSPEHTDTGNLSTPGPATPPRFVRKEAELCGQSVNFDPRCSNPSMDRAGSSNSVKPPKYGIFSRTKPEQSSNVNDCSHPDT